MTISGSPRDTRFFQGLEFTFTCSIILDAAVDTSLTVQGTWNRNGTELVNDGRISVSYAPLAMPPYKTTLTFNPLNISDAGAYECSTTVTPQDTAFVIGITSSTSRNITVAGIARPCIKNRLFNGFVYSLSVITGLWYCLTGHIYVIE